MAIYHFTASKGQKGKHSARAKVDYIARHGDYARNASDVVEIHSGHMPAWAEVDPRTYWEAADKYERKNGRLFRQYEFSLPKELTVGQQSELAESFCRSLATTPHGVLPFTYAIHHGKGENPHCHLIVSERLNDGIYRTPEMWFRRAGKIPEQGGAIKTDYLESKERLLELRRQWKEAANVALQRAGREERIDHRSLQDQGLSRLPMIHIGPHVLEMERKGIATRKGQEALERYEENERRREAERGAQRTADRRADRTIGAEYGGLSRRPTGRNEAGTGTDRADNRKGGQDCKELAGDISSSRKCLDELDSQTGGLGTERKMLRTDRGIEHGDTRFSCSIDRILFLAAPLQRGGTGTEDRSDDMASHQRTHAEFVPQRSERHQETAWMEADRRKARGEKEVANDRTEEAVAAQLRAMDCMAFDIGIRDRETGKMMNKEEISSHDVLTMIPWLKRMNARGNDIYIRPARSLNRSLILVDDLDGIGVESLEEKGIPVSLIVETSPKNLQVWVDLKTEMTERERSIIAKKFAFTFGGDPASAEARHYGRLAGFTNRKPEHLTERGFPFCLCRRSSGAKVSEEMTAKLICYARSIIAQIDERVRRVEAVKTAPVFVFKKGLSAIDVFRSYLGDWWRKQAMSEVKLDWSRGDYAVSCRMLIAGYSPEEIQSAMVEVSPRLVERKGTEQKAAQYAERTVRAAQIAPETISQQERQRQQSRRQSHGIGF